MSTPSKVRVAILDDYQRVALTSADWSSVSHQLAIDVFPDTLLSDDALVARLEPYTIICAMRERTKFSASVLDRLPNLKFIATTGMKNAAIDVKHATSKGVVVSGTGGSGNSTLEHIWALILATARHLVIEDKNVKEGKEQWQSTLPIGLAGRTLGLIGVGRLGAQTAKVGVHEDESGIILTGICFQIAKAFDMRVVGWSPNLTPERAAEGGVEYAGSKEELFKQSDIVSIHMVLSDRTRGFVNAADLALMKPTAILINSSRGPLIQEEALIDVLQRKKIAGAGLDVYDVEPLPLDHALRKLDNVTLSPHMGYVSDKNYEVREQGICSESSLTSYSGVLDPYCRQYFCFLGWKTEEDTRIEERINVVGTFRNTSTCGCVKYCGAKMIR